MAAYSDKRCVRIMFPEWDFGIDATDLTLSFRLPKNEDGTAMAGTLVKIGVMVTKTFACSSTAAKVKLGVSGGDDDAYALLNIANAAAANDCFDETDDTDAIISASIAAGTLLQMTLVSGVDGSADAGKGMPFMDFWLSNA